MPVSEPYFLQYLLERTNTEPPDINWRQASPAGYWAAVAGIRLWLRMVSEVTGSRLVLDLDDSLYEVSIVEPRAEGLFRRRYEPDEEDRLSKLFQQLFASVARQVLGRQMAAVEMEEAVKERMFRCVLFQDCGSLAAMGQVSL